MLDEATRGAFHLAEAQARKQGKPLMEVLDRYGLLITDDRERMLMINCIDSILAQLDEQPDTAYASLGGDQTVSGGIRGVKTYIRAYRTMLERQTRS
jgi:hypothetical protein